MKSLVVAIKHLIKKEGSEAADNILCGMLMIHKDYHSLKQAIEDYLTRGRR